MTFFSDALFDSAGSLPAAQICRNIRNYAGGIEKT